MATAYKETVKDDQDAEGKILAVLSDGNPYVFVVTVVDFETGDLDMSLATGGGIPDVRTVRSLLSKALAALPE